MRHFERTGIQPLRLKPLGQAVVARRSQPSLDFAVSVGSAMVRKIPIPRGSSTEPDGHAGVI
jgi:hypothetical protein